MTRNPVAVREDRLAAEIVHVFEQHRIDEIIVVDAQRHVIGLVDVQDLSRASIF